MSVGRRNRHIDGFRGVAILLVLLHHFNIAYPLAATSLGTVLTPDFVRAVVRNGDYGVTIFFAVSGFLITSNALRRWGSLGGLRPRAFYTLRIARIVPNLLLLLAVVGGLATAGLGLFQSHLPGSGQPVSPVLVYGAALGFWMNVLIGRLGWVNYPLGVLWSLSVEEVFYLTFPAVCFLLRRPSWIAGFWLVIVLVGPAYRAAHQGDEGGFLFAYFAAFDSIAIGCLAALTQRAIAGWLAGAAAIGMVATYLAAPIGLSTVWGVSAMAAGTAVLLLRAEQEPGETAGRRWGRVIPWFGHLSYELYLFHLVVLGILRTAYPAKSVPADGRLLLLLLFLAASACIAAVVSRFYAEPLNRALRSRLLARFPERTDAQPQTTSVSGSPSQSNRA